MPEKIKITQTKTPNEMLAEHIENINSYKFLKLVIGEHTIKLDDPDVNFEIWLDNKPTIGLITRCAVLHILQGINKTKLSEPLPKSV